MKTYSQYPPRKLQSMGYDGPIEISQVRAIPVAARAARKGRREHRGPHRELSSDQSHKRRPRGFPGAVRFAHFPGTNEWVSIRELLWPIPPINPSRLLMLCLCDFD